MDDQVAETEMIWQFICQRDEPDISINRLFHRDHMLFDLEIL